MHKAGACAEADLKFANKKFSPASFCILLMIGFNSGVRDAIGEKNGFMWEKFPIHILIFVFVITNIKVTNKKEIQQGNLLEIRAKDNSWMGRQKTKWTDISVQNVYYCDFPGQD